MNNGDTLRLSRAERRMILDRLYERFAALGEAYGNQVADRRDKHRIRMERKALSLLINKIEGTQAINVQIELCVLRQRVRSPQ